MSTYQKKEDFKKIDRLIIPGGESTTLLNILHKHGLWDELKLFCRNKPVFGTCAGSILLSNGNNYLNAIDIDVQRNAYGSQVHSFADNVSFCKSSVPAIFIRAPIINKIGDSVETLVSYKNTPVLVRQANILACTFHPELGESNHIHEYFLSM